MTQIIKQSDEGKKRRLSRVGAPGLATRPDSLRGGQPDLNIFVLLHKRYTVSSLVDDGVKEGQVTSVAYRLLGARP